MKTFARALAAMLPVLLTILYICAPVSATPAGQFDPITEGIYSDYYQVQDQYITGIAPGTSAEKVMHTCVPSGLTASSDQAGTGTVFTYTAPDGTQRTLTAVTIGDLNGDAAITLADLLKTRSYLLGNELEAIAQAAGDLNGDGKMTIADYLRVKAYLLGREAAPTVPTAQGLFLMTPFATAQWTVEAAAYQSGDETLLTVDATGLISTKNKEGSAFVYALDAEGNIVTRQLVTILSEKLTFTLAATKAQLVVGQTMTLKPVFNHPVNPALVWTSSDAEIVTVEDGVLTGLKMGKATVTATTDQGQTASLEVSVAPPIESMNIERKLYKVKPGNTKKLTLFTEPADTGEEITWTTSDPAIATVSADGTVTGVAYGTVTVTATGKYSGLTAQCKVKICDVKQVAITFDDGPAPYTEKLLDFLKENDIRVTFFLVGNRMSSYSEEVIREAAEGHEMGYHSYSHATQTGLSSERITSDFEKADKILFDLTGQHFTVWRTPGGAFNTRVLNAVPVPHIMWSVDTLDWQTLNAYSVYSAIVNKTRDGDIVLIHDLHRTSVDGAIMALEQMLEGDYEFLTVTELLSRDGTPPQPSTNYYSGR